MTIQFGTLFNLRLSLSLGIIILGMGINSWALDVDEKIPSSHELNYFKQLEGIKLRPHEMKDLNLVHLWDFDSINWTKDKNNRPILMESKSLFSSIPVWAEGRGDVGPAYCHRDNGSDPLNDVGLFGSPSAMIVRDIPTATHLDTGDDFTIGGWFKTDPDTNGANFISKMPVEGLSGSAEPEWQLMTSGEIIYFNMYRRRTDSRYYLDELAAMDYRQPECEREKPRVLLTKIKPRKPVPLPPPPIDVPCKPKPRPPLPPIYGPITDPGYGEVKKTHFSGDYSIRSFWHGDNFGHCFINIDKSGMRRRECWHFLALSFNMSDRVKPTRTLFVMRDPRLMKSFQPKDFIYIDKSTFRDRNAISMPPVKGRNPIILGNGFSGAMQGVFFAKKAFNRDELLEMAYRYSPMGNLACDRWQFVRRK